MMKKGPRQKDNSITNNLDNIRVFNLSGLKGVYIVDENLNFKCLLIEEIRIH